MQPSGEVTIEDKILYYTAVGVFVLLVGGLFAVLRFVNSANATGRLLRRLLGNALVVLCLCMALFLALEFYWRYFYDSTDSFGATRTTARWFYRHYFIR